MASASPPIGGMPHASPASDGASSETAAPGQDHGHHNPTQDELTILPQFKFTLVEVDYLDLALLDDEEDDEEEEAAADRIAADDDDGRFQEEADDVAHAARNWNPTSEGKVIIIAFTHNSVGFMLSRAFWDDSV